MYNPTGVNAATGIGAAAAAGSMTGSLTMAVAAAGLAIIAAMGVGRVLPALRRSRD